MDKSFEGLLFSVVVHVLVLWLLLFAKLPKPTVSQDATQITLIEKPSQEKHKGFVTETDKKEPDLKDLKDSADFLSQFTKRVKKQMKARNNGPTVNAQPKQALNLNPTRQHVAGQKSTDREKSDDGVGMPREQGGSQAMRTVAIGQSSLAEYIPGIDEGAFTALNTDQFTYYTFFARMNEQVRNRWVSLMRNYINSLSAQDLEKLSRRERQTLIEIVLGPDGQFRNALLHTSCGEQQLDRIPAQAFQAAAPFPNPPHGMIEEDGLIHLKYAFVLQFRPPSFGPVTN